LETKELLTMHTKMLELRRFEEKVEELYAQGLIPGVAHPYIGQEAVAVGVCSALRNDDYILSNHRGHGHNIAKGVPSKFIMAELFGKEGGVCKGIGGSMHSTQLEVGVLFTTAIVGGNIPIATGIGLAIKLRNEDRVVVSFFGDGATNTGAFHEGINLAALWKLPAIFVCENNLYGMSVPVSKSVSAKNIADRGVAYNIPGEIVDGNDVEAVYNSTLKAVERARRGEGPSLLECVTYRYKGHGIYDTGLSYRTREEIETWKKKDPLKRSENKLRRKGVKKEQLMDIEKDVDSIIEEAVAFSKSSNYPSWDQMLAAFKV